MGAMIPLLHLDGMSGDDVDRCSARSTSPSSPTSGAPNDLLGQPIPPGVVAHHPRRRADPRRGRGRTARRTAQRVAERVELNIYEPPRFFEAFLRGRAHTEPPDLTARICGICPVAYQTSAMNAIEDACGVTLDPQVVALRRLLYCGEWIHSHALHIYMLHAPDFLGEPDIISVARNHRRRGSAAWR